MTPPTDVPPLRVHKLRPDAVVPRYMTAAAAGLDLSCAMDEPVTLAPGARAALGTGLAVAIPPGHEGQVRPRSGLALRRGVTVVNAPGTIDADYRGEVVILLINLGAEPVTVTPGERIAQFVIAPVTRVAVVETDALAETERGAGGFGSTGTGAPSGA
jgi:dUTP pyrophosphatase